MKTILITLCAFAFWTTPPVAEESFDEEYCYELDVEVNGLTITAQGCGATPQEGLQKLGEAVRFLAAQR